MIIQPIPVNQGDYGYELGPWTLEDGGGSPQDLDGATLVLNVQDAQDPSGDLLFSSAVSIDDASAGLVHFTVPDGSFPNPGTFIAQIVASYESEQVSWPAFQIIVKPSLPQLNN